MEKTTTLSIEKSGCLKIHREEYKLINDRKHFILYCEINSKFRKNFIAEKPDFNNSLYLIKPINAETSRTKN